MDDEISNLKTNKTWELVKCPRDTNIVELKWVFRLKKKPAGEVVKHKARVVARGFTQQYGVDYFKTYAPVARLASIRTILAIAARNNWPIKAFDFQSAYLNVSLDGNEEIFIELPPGYVSEHPDVVVRLLKVLYGLKQAGWKWYEKLRKELKELGLTRCEVDPGIFYGVVDGETIILAVHVNDCILAGSSEAILDEFRTELDKRLKLTDLGSLSWLLGIKVTRDIEEHTLSLSQEFYIDSILHRFNFEDQKPVATPIDPTIQYTKAQCPTTLADISHMKNIPYRAAVGSLMYAATGTRPDIAFAIQNLSRFSENPAQVHWEAVKHVFRYLKGMKTWVLKYGGDR